MTKEGEGGRGAAIQRVGEGEGVAPVALEDEEPSAAGTMSIQLRAEK